MLDILQRFYRDHRSAVVLVVALGACAVALQLGSFLLVVDYISALLGTSTRLPSVDQWINYQPDNFSIQVPLIVCVGLMASGLFNYKARDYIVNRMLVHERRCIRELLEEIHRLAYLAPGQHQVNDIVRSISRDIRYYGRLVDALLDFCLPVVFFLASAALLFYLAPSLTLVVFGVVAIFGYVFLRLSLRVSKLGIQLEQLAPADMAARKRGINQALLGSSNSAELPAVLDRIDRDTDIDAFLDIYGKRLRISFQAAFFTSIFLAIMIAAVLYYLGSELKAGNDVIADILIYVLALNYALVQVRSLAAILTKIRVFQPFAERYLSLLAALKDNASATSSNIFSLSNAQIYGGSSVPTRTYNPGESFGVAYAGALDKLVVGNICYSIGLSPNFPLSPSLIHRYIPDDLGGMRRLLEAFEGYSEEMLNELNAPEILQTVRDELEIAKSSFSGDDLWENVHRRVAFILQAIEAHLNNETNVVFIEGKGFRGIRQKGQDEIKRLLSEKIQILVYPNPPPKPIFGVTEFFAHREYEDNDEQELMDELGELS